VNLSIPCRIEIAAQQIKFMINIRSNLARLLLGAVLVAMVLGAYLFSDPTRHCGAEYRPKSDDELITIALEVEASRGGMKIDGLESSISLFRSDHPECCTVYRANNQSPAAIRLRYEASEINRLTLSPRSGKYVESLIAFDVCGEVKHRDSGSYTYFPFD
jgi:hypothetical protein